MEKQVATGSGVMHTTLYTGIKVAVNTGVFMLQGSITDGLCALLYAYYISHFNFKNYFKFT